MPENSPEYVQTSTAAAMTMKFLPGRFHRGARLNALNLLLTYEDGCKAKCSYCGLSKSREIEEEDRTFIRVDWPSYSLEEIVKRSKDHGKHLHRVCVSMITHPKALEDMCFVMRKFKDETELSISGLISPTMIRDSATIQKIRDAGADMVGIAVDAVTPELFEQHRGKGVSGPHKWNHYWEVVRWSAEVFGPGNVGVHLIVGLGETEKEFVDTIQRAEDLGAKTHLFSFYPEEGSKLQELSQPTYGKYRRIQLARYIINEGLGTYDNMKFNEKGQITDFGVNIDDIIENGEAFMTSGCPGKDKKVACNRPYGNERPSKPIRNFPFLPEDQDKKMIRKQLEDYST
ncbi:MAG: radical SAM protein [Thermoplasmata archaeon]|nr:MAG: radical SAM protein [Thermoplasmata archaeon]